MWGPTQKQREEVAGAARQLPTSSLPLILYKGKGDEIRGPCEPLEELCELLLSNHRSFAYWLGQEKVV